MDALVLRDADGGGLFREQRSTPEPARGQVVLRMIAAGLNYRDGEIVRGTYHTKFATPLIPLSDGCGEVVAVGPNVRRFAVGDIAITAFWQRWTAGSFEQCDPSQQLGGPLDGVLAEYACFDEDGLVQVPAGMSPVDAATLPCAAVTAYQSLIVEGGMKVGDTVLVQGTGGVSIFALQLAVAAGAEVVVISSSDEKLDRAVAMGASACVNYRRTPNWGDEVRQLAGGRGVDHVIEVGGPSTFDQSLAALRPGGQINVIGYLGGPGAKSDPLAIFRKKATVRGIPVGPRSTLEAVVHVVSKLGIKPVVHNVIGWRDAAQAVDELFRAEHVGKLMLSFSEG